MISCRSPLHDTTILPLHDDCCCLPCARACVLLLLLYPREALAAAVGGREYFLALLPDGAGLVYALQPGDRWPMQLGRHVSEGAGGGVLAVPSGGRQGGAPCTRFTCV
jgi:hypothetical protein